MHNEEKHKYLEVFSRTSIALGLENHLRWEEEKVESPEKSLSHSLEGRNEEEEASQNHRTHSEANPKTPHLIVLVKNQVNNFCQFGCVCQSGGKGKEMIPLQAEGSYYFEDLSASGNLCPGPQDPVVRDETDVPGAQKIYRNQGDLGFLHLAYESERAWI
ncbi:hypothetical protein VNO78_18640 [Psophocarpus tetragonolobus]|uniref:Uncharacterized protein n=1 Tax=Psophocarpus tetragonolobus TaxID=3891 RepID=A0AAN9XM82_PSOTE